jgi:hypothetical protein
MLYVHRKGFASCFTLVFTVLNLIHLLSNFSLCLTDTLLDIPEGRDLAFMLGSLEAKHISGG